jgi:hypothetical protein
MALPTVLIGALSRAAFIGTSPFYESIASSLPGESNNNDAIMPDKINPSPRPWKLHKGNPKKPTFKKNCYFCMIKSRRIYAGYKHMVRRIQHDKSYSCRQQTAISRVGATVSKAHF